MANERILLVDDDTELTALMSQYLQSNGFEVAIEHSGDAVEQHLAQSTPESTPDLILLDLMLPGKDGLTVCKEIRDKFHAPILMLTALNDDIDEVTGLEVGADDYLTKPIKPRVLLAHIRAQLRRYGRVPNQVESALVSIRNGEVEIDPGKREVRKDGQAVELTSAEFDLLWLLASNRGKTLSREDLYQHIYRLPFDGLDRSIDLRVSRLRKKLGMSQDAQPYIITVRSIGYQLAD